MALEKKRGFLFSNDQLPSIFPSILHRHVPEGASVIGHFVNIYQNGRSLMTLILLKSVTAAVKERRFESALRFHTHGFDQCAADNHWRYNFVDLGLEGRHVA
jgi:hypothetical protein